ncbi:MAG: hypothetical protein JJT81_02805 [Rubellimicrobium sp.]|nr:hypothetical protein [Rubellimicrobium sp.]
MIDMRHELVKLAALIDREVFERKWAGLFPSPAGRPGLVAPKGPASLKVLENALVDDGRGRRAGEQDGPHDLGTDHETGE